MQGKVVAVTGGSGFIGTHLLTALLADADITEIYVLDAVPPRLEHPKIKFITCDIRKSIAFVPPAPIHCCFHLAAVCREPGFDWDEYFQTNYQGTRVVCEWASKSNINNLVFTSTAMVFRAGEERNSEESLPNADSAYGISKALAEEVLRGWQSANSGRRLRIVRPGVVFGKNGGGNFSRLFSALRRRMFFYIGRDSTVKSAIYVKDLVRLLQVVASDSQPYWVYHGVYPQPTTVRSICAAFCETYSWKRSVLTLPYRPALLAALFFQMLDAAGLKNPIHYRRIQKLYQSTNLSAERLKAIEFELKYSLADAISDWRRDCRQGELI